MAAGLLIATLGWSLFAFGAVYTWALVPVIIAALVACWLARPVIAARGERWLDGSLLAMLAAAGLQLIPLPQTVRLMLSPGIADYDARVSITAAGVSGWHPLSLVPSAWLWGAGTLVTAVLIFWAVRETASAYGARFFARAIAWMGLTVSFIALVQPALFSNHKIYGFWTPLSPGAHAIGPIVNRNHFAAWIVLALPITAGYVVAHVRTHWVGRRTRIDMLADTRAFWLFAAGGLMIAALFISQSRSGAIGLAAALLFGLVRGWRRSGTGGRIALIAYVVVLAAAATFWSSPDALVQRFDHALSGTFGGRPDIWREAWQVVRQFWQVGVGLGALTVVMAVYQTAPHLVLFNHAHNQYLQLLAEGGVLVAAPAAIAIASFFALAVSRAGRDQSAIAAVREGALAGIVGFAVQCVWEVPLLTPGVLFLLATAAALAIHRAPRTTRPPAEAVP